MASAADSLSDVMDDMSDLLNPGENFLLAFPPTTLASNDTLSTVESSS